METRIDTPKDMQYRAELVKRFMAIVKDLRGLDTVSVHELNNYQIESLGKSLLEGKEILEGLMAKNERFKQSIQRANASREERKIPNPQNRVHDPLKTVALCPCILEKYGFECFQVSRKTVFFYEFLSQVKSSPLWVRVERKQITPDSVRYTVTVEINQKRQQLSTEDHLVQLLRWYVKKHKLDNYRLEERVSMRLTST